MDPISCVGSPPSCRQHGAYFAPLPWILETCRRKSVATSEGTTAEFSAGRTLACGGPDRPKRVARRANRDRLLPHNEELDFEAVLSGTLSHEPEVFRFLDSRLGQYDAVIEIGANVGVFTLYLAKRMQEQGGSGKIFSFEPSRKAYARLVQNIELNQANNVLAFNCAIGRRSEIVNFYEPVGHLMNGSLNAEFAAGFSSQVKMVPVIVLDAQIILALITRPSRVLIKIDTEGAEAVIILALSKIITQLQPDLLVEVLPEFEGAIREAIEKVAPGYESFAITKEGTCRQAAISSHALRDCFLTPSTVKPG